MIPFAGTFKSLDDCLVSLKQKYPQSKVTIPARDYDSDKKSLVQVPKYLFRGESDHYPSTFSFMQRLKQIPLIPNDVVDEVENVTTVIGELLQEQLGEQPGSKLVAGYVQHYGLPTEFLDLTSNLETAFFFSSYPSRFTGIEQGVLGVVTVEEIHDRCTIADLTEHKFAKRPSAEMQSAYGLFHERILDFKNVAPDEKFKIDWYRYASSKDEKGRYYDKLKHILSTADDHTAGLMNLHLRGLAGSLSTPAASYISNLPDIPLTPLVTNLGGIPVTYRDFGFPLDELKERGILFCLMKNLWVDAAKWSLKNPKDKIPCPDCISEFLSIQKAPLDQGKQIDVGMVCKKCNARKKATFKNRGYALN